MEIGRNRREMLKGHEIFCKFVLIPADKKWVASMSGELNNAATYV